jgi:methionyl-tRNA synthetase
VISFDDWLKVDIRVGRVLSVKEHGHSLYVVKLFDGERERQIVAGLKRYYKPEELEGKLVLFLANLEPKVIRGVKSEGMLLAVEKDDTVALIVPERSVGEGAKVV